MRLLTMGLTLRAWQNKAHPREEENRGALRLIRGLCLALAPLALTTLMQPVSAQDSTDQLPERGTADNRESAACVGCGLMSAA